MMQQFKDILIGVTPEIFDDPTANLIENGIIDSLDIMNIVAELELAFGISFDPDDVAPETFATADALWRVVDRYVRELEG
jgi:acyl carrier protein